MLVAWLLLTASIPGLGAENVVHLVGGALDLTIESASGRVVGVTVDGRKVPLGSSIGLSGFAIADRAAGGDFVPVPCTVRQEAGTWVLEGEISGVRLRATVASAPAALGPIQVHLSDTTGNDRAISLRFALPVSGDGWAFSRSLDRRVTIVPGVQYDNATRCAIGSGKLDLWPTTAISSSSDDLTLALSTPMDRPCIFHVGFDGDRGLFYISADFALTELTKKHPREADFVFGIHGTADGWGLRSALAAYYQTYPHLFERRTDRAGGWFAWGDILALEPPVCDFGLRFHEGAANQTAHQHDRALGILSFPYIEPGMFQLHFGDFDHRPTRDEIMARLRDYAGEVEAEAASSRSTDPYGNVKRMCRAILASGVRDAHGELVIGAVGQYPWVANNRWAAQFPLVLDPDIPDGAAQLYLKWAAKNIPREEWGEGQYLDSYSAHVTRVDYDPRHLAVADHPVSFDPKTFAPCQLMAIPMFEYVEKLRDQLQPYNKLILVNAYGHSAPFPFHQFDVLGKEHWISPSGRLFERYRALAYHKPVTNLPSYEPVNEAFLDECLVYDIFPGGYGRGNWHQEEMRDDYRRVIPFLRLLDKLGWEPVTWARCSAEEARVERYGPSGKGGPVCFVIYNPYAPQLVTLDVPLESLGIPKQAWCEELLYRRPLSWQREGNSLRVSVAFKPRETALIAIAEADGHRSILEMLARDRLADAELCAIEWQLRNETTHPLADRLAKREEPRPTAIREMAAETARVSDPLNRRMTDLLRIAADLLDRAGSIQPARSQVVEAPEVAPAGATLPWIETFNTLDPERWNFPEEHPGIEVEDGKLLLSLTGNIKSVGLGSKEAFDFGTRPLEFRFGFQYNHAGHQWYLMQSFQLMPVSSGTSDDFIHIRMDPRVRVRVENGEAPATNWQRTLTDWVAFRPNQPHEAVLWIDKSTFRLTIDGKDCGSGRHELRFGLGYIHLGLYSGHGGHGDVCSFDEIEVREG